MSHLSRQPVWSHRRKRRSRLQLVLPPFLLICSLGGVNVFLTGRLFIGLNQDYGKNHALKSYSSVTKSQTKGEAPLLLTRQGMLELGSQMGRSFYKGFQTRRTKAQAQSLPNPDHFWCRHVPKDAWAEQGFLTPTLNSTTEGLFYVKTPKTASESINRILKRVVTQVAKRNANKTTASSCFFRGHHIQGDPKTWYSHRHDTYSLLITSLRDPATRALSRLYWTLSTRQFFVNNNNTNNVDWKALLQSWKDIETGCISNGQGGFQLHYISLDKLPPQSTWTADQPTKVQQVDQVHTQIQHVLREYDFILIQERLDESLVALQLLMGLDTTDILSMPLHMGGSYLYDRHAGCLPLVSPPKLPHLDPRGADPTTPQAMLLDDYLQSQEWYAQNYGDYVLLGAAHASLDLTIARLGNAFGKALKDFRTMQQSVLDVCSKQVVFPCSKNGTIQREDYELGKPTAAGDRYPQKDIEHCIDQIIQSGGTTT